MKLFGKIESKATVLKKIGDISQLGGIKSYEFSDGLRKGARAIDIKTPAGLDITILPDRGMDISNLTYKSIPICWRSVTRETSPVFFESRGLEWLRTFFGGLLTTCGLTYTGFPCIDEGEELGLHGRISNLSAENVCTKGKWIENNYVMWVQGTVREVKVYGEKLELTRKITAWMDKPKILIEDTVENIGYEKSPIMLLYHINIGYPVLDETSRLLEPKAKVIPRDEEARKGFGKYFEFSEPTAGFKEQAYFHDIEADENGNANIALVNEEFNNKRGIGIWLKYSKETLPILAQWKQMGLGEYVCGIEPSTSFVKGRKVEREEGTLKFIDPGEKMNFRIELNILTSNEDIEKFKKEFCK